MQVRIRYGNHTLKTNTNNIEAAIIKFLNICLGKREYKILGYCQMGNVRVYRCFSVREFEVHVSSDCK